MKESKHIAVNEAKWDKWAEKIDGKGWKYEYLRKAQDSIIALLEMKEDTRLLDVGCGTGKALFFASEKNNGNGIFYGVDLSEKMIEKAEANFVGKENFHFLKANAESIPLPDGFFDYIIC
ncbi:MAG: class I SAM-dependent methyltransferase, partial [Chitinophagaceae bacterium]